MEGVIAVAAPFAMVVAIVWIVQQGKSKRAEVYRGRSGQDEAIIGAMQQQIDKLTDRVADRAVEARSAVHLEEAGEERRLFCRSHVAPNESGGACAPPSILAVDGPRR